MPGLIHTIRTASGKSWWLTFLWVGYHALGSLMPIWGTYLVLRLYHQQSVLNDFVKHGEFALYAATFLAIALPQVVRNIRETKYVLGTGSVLFAVASLVVSALIYSGVVIATQSPAKQSPWNLDEQFLFCISMVLFVSSLGFAALVTLIEMEQTNPNVVGAEARDQSALRNKVASKGPAMTPEIPDEETLGIISEDELASEFNQNDDEPEPEAGEGESHG
jgi:hypothetical protein